MHKYHSISGCICLCLCFIISSSWGQIVDDFSDGNLTQNPTWVGDLGDFTINSALQLQLMAAEAGARSIYLSFDPTDSMEIGLDVYLDFDPSTSNLLRQSLLQDAPVLANASRALYYEIGESGSGDALRLMEKINGVESEIYRSEALSSSSEIAIRVDLKWVQGEGIVLSIDQGIDGSTEQTHTMAYTESWTAPTYFVIDCMFTSTRKDKFRFDNVQIEALKPDVTPANIALVEVPQLDTLILRLDEAVKDLQIGQFELDPFVGSIVQAIRISPSSYMLVLSEEMINGAVYQLAITDLEDLAGNVNPRATYAVDVLVGQIPAVRALLINEIMSAPSAQNQLPEAEYIELYNPTDEYLSLQGLQFSDGPSTATFDHYIMEPKEYVVVTDQADAASFADVNVIGLNNFPSLNNAGDALILSLNGQQIDAVQYSSSWVTDNDRPYAALERINPSLNCDGAINWASSLSFEGGTPGKINSVYSDTIAENPVRIDAIQVNSPLDLLLQMHAQMDEATVYDPAAYTFTPILTIESIFYDEINQSIEITFVDPMEDGVIYELVLAPSIKNCANFSSPENSVYSFGIPQQIARGDVVLNEVLYEPPTGGAEYIELFNHTDKLISLARCEIVLSRVDANDQSTSLSTFNDLLIPNTFWALSKLPSVVQEQYEVPYPERLKEINLMSLTNDGGMLTLICSDANGDSLHIDQVNYSEDFHDPLIDAKGYSLERLSPSLNGLLATSWHSASSLSGGGTPTAANSQTSSMISSENMFELASPTFSPDNDGFEDWMELHVQNDNPSLRITLTIYDKWGYQIARLLNNENLGASATIRWDGITDDGALAPVGPYVIVIDGLDNEGKRLHEQHNLTIAKHL